MPYQLVALCYVIINFYIFLHVRKWSAVFIKPLVKVIHLLLMILFWFPTLSTFLAALIPVSFPIQRFFKTVSNYWIVCLVYTGVPCMIADLVNIVVRLSKKRSAFEKKKVFFFTGFAVLVLTLSMGIFGHLNAENIQATHFDVNIDKTCGERDSLRVALVADTHIGYNMGLKETEKMVRLINDENVDLVLFAGDIFDNEFEGIKDPDRIAAALSGIESTYGSYACWGNHDINETLFCGFTINWENASDDTPYLDFLNKAGIRMLNDETVLIDDSFYLIGRKDAQRTYKKQDSLYSVSSLVKNLDPEKPILLMDHQPRNLTAISETNVDVEFAGHTHGGQVFPGTLLIGLLYENACGMKTFGNMTSLTSAGVGCWGPYIRTGVKSEVLIADIHFR